MRLPIRKKRLLEHLDDAEVLEGYRDGSKNDPEPHSNRSYSYWHGWRNGMVDGGYKTKDKSQQALAHDYIHGEK